jgi:hypothetical protein
VLVPYEIKPPADHVVDNDMPVVLGDVYLANFAVRPYE